MRYDVCHTRTYRSAPIPVPENDHIVNYHGKDVDSFGTFIGGNISYDVQLVYDTATANAMLSYLVRTTEDVWFNVPNNPNFRVRFNVMNGNVKWLIYTTVNSTSSVTTERAWQIKLKEIPGMPNDVLTSALVEQQQKLINLIITELYAPEVNRPPMDDGGVFVFDK